MATSRQKQRDPESAGASALGSRIAFFGAGTLVARELRSLLDSRGFPALSVKLFDAEREGSLGEYDGEALITTVPDRDTIVDLDIAFMCGSIADTTRYIRWPEQRGFVAVDLSGASRSRKEVPVIHTEINPDLLSPGPSVVAAPHPVAHNLATLVAAARGAAPVSRAEVLALRPVSDMGDKAIDELYRQTVALLNFSEAPTEVFGRQMAFNVLPSSGMIGDRIEEFDAGMAEEAARILGMETCALRVTSAFVPVFHGHSLSVTLTFDRPVTSGEITERLASTPGVRHVEDPSRFSPAELVGEEDVAVLGPTIDARRPERAGFWVFCDNLKGGAALNVVRIAERLVELRRESAP